jgi:hypothetical protein
MPTKGCNGTKFQALIGEGTIKGSFSSHCSISAKMASFSDWPTLPSNRPLTTLYSWSSGPPGPTPLTRPLCPNLVCRHRMYLAHGTCHSCLVPLSSPLTSAMSCKPTDIAACFLVTYTWTVAVFAALAFAFSWSAACFSPTPFVNSPTGVESIGEVASVPGFGS